MDVEAPVLPPRSPGSSKSTVSVQSGNGGEMKSSKMVQTTTSPVSALNFDDDDVALFGIEEMKISVDDEALKEFVCSTLGPLNPPLECASSSDNEPLMAALEENDDFPLISTKQLDRPERVTRCKSDTSILNVLRGEQSMMNLAEDCVKNGDFNTGIALYQSLLREQEKQKSTRFHPKIATTLHKIGDAHLLANRFDAASDYFKEAVDIRAKSFGCLNVHVAHSLLKLGTARLHGKHFVESHTAFRRALRINLKLHGINHPIVAYVHTQLGCVSFGMGEMLAASASFEEALDVYQLLAKTTNLSEHQKWMNAVAEALCNIASVRLHQKQFQRALNYFQDALKIQKQIGAQPLSLCSTLDNIGFAQTKEKRYPEAAKTHEELLRVQLEHFKVYNLASYETLKKLNWLYEKSNNLRSAFELTLQAYSVQKRTLSHEDIVFKKTEKMLMRLQRRSAACR